MRRLLPLMLLTGLSLVAAAARSQASVDAQTALYGFAGWATYYGIEDGFIRGDVMYDGTSYDPADPTIAAASFLFPLHTWLRVCTQAQCIIVQVRDRGLLDENSVLLDLSRAAYALLFGGLGGKQWISAYYSDPATLGVEPAPYITGAAAPSTIPSAATPVALMLPAPTLPPPSPALPPVTPPPNSIRIPGPR